MESPPEIPDIPNDDLFAPEAPDDDLDSQIYLDDLI